MWKPFRIRENKSWEGLGEDVQSMLIVELTTPNQMAACWTLHSSSRRCQDLASLLIRRIFLMSSGFLFCFNLRKTLFISLGMDNISAVIYQTFSFSLKPFPCSFTAYLVSHGCNMDTRTKKQKWVSSTQVKMRLLAVVVLPSLQLNPFQADLVDTWVSIYSTAWQIWGSLQLIVILTVARLFVLWGHNDANNPRNNRRKCYMP